MGSVFSFVSSDLKQKIDVLQELLDKDQNNYQTIKTMIEHEKGNNLLEKKDFVSGARTFLRLHRGLGEYLILNYYYFFFSMNKIILFCRLYF